MTLTDLARTSQIPLRTLSAYENGEHSPKPDMVRRLAEILEVTPAFLEREEIEFIDPDAVSFRKLSKTTARLRDSALAAGRFAIEIADWNDDNFRLPKPDLPTLDKHDPDTAARILRERWGLGEQPISNVVHLVEAHGVRVFSVASDCRDIDAFSFYRDGVPFIFLNVGVSGERQRFDCAHELGHLLLHMESDRAHGRDKEIEANRFAAALLMPERGVIAQGLREATLEGIIAAKRYWMVSAMAMTHRLHEMRLISDWNYRNTCVALSSLGYRNGEPDGVNGERSQVLSKIVRALREDGVGPEAICKDLGLTLDELNRHIFGLAPHAVRGGGQRSPRQGVLQMVQ
ncbi:XRE family transcriptional regulator [Frankia sp. AgB1.8]|nr:XRE family transcriptional regulator [Frankia sp. AgB1.8]